jgi:hypothetical protein
MHNRTGGRLGDQRKSCYDCIHVLPAINGSEVMCEIYTFKFTRYNVRKRGSLDPGTANDCSFFQPMTPEEKTASEKKFREFYQKLGKK